MARRPPDETVERSYAAHAHASPTRLCLSVACEGRGRVRRGAARRHADRGPRRRSEPARGQPVAFAPALRHRGARRLLSVRDLGSRNGTHVDGRAVGETPSSLGVGAEAVAGTAVSPCCDAPRCPTRGPCSACSRPSNQRFCSLAAPRCGVGLRLAQPPRHVLASCASCCPVCPKGRCSASFGHRRARRARTRAPSTGCPRRSQSATCCVHLPTRAAPKRAPPRSCGACRRSSPRATPQPLRRPKGTCPNPFVSPPCGASTTSCGGLVRGPSACSSRARRARAKRWPRGSCTG